MVSSILPTKWIRAVDTDDHGCIWHDLNLGRYVLHIYRAKRQDQFHSQQKWNLSLRDRKNFCNLALSSFENRDQTLKKCKERAMLAFIFIFAVKLLRNSDSPEKIWNKGQVWDV